MSEIEKLYENARVLKECLSPCYINKTWRKTHDCPNCDNREYYPPFTAEKQLLLLQWICKKFQEIYISHTDFKEFQSWEIVYKISVHRNSFEECLCAFINLFWQSLTEEEKRQVKGILE